MSESATAFGEGGSGGQGAAGAGEGAGSGAKGGSGEGAGSGAGNKGGSGAKSWRDSLPEEIRAHASISSFQDVESLTKAFIHTKSLVGKKGVIKPDDKAPPEDWQAFYSELGVPSADKYEVEAPKDYKIPDEILKGFKELSAKNGVLPKQANEYLKWFATAEKASLEARNKAAAADITKGIENLKKEWGDAYDRNINAVRFIIKEKGNEDLIKLMNSKTPIVVGDNPVMLKFFAEAAKLMGEDKLREGGASDGSQSPDEINAELAELRAKGHENGLFNKNHPMHNVTLKKMEELAKKLTGGR